MIAAAGWVFLAMSLLSPEKMYQSDVFPTLQKCEDEATALRARPTLYAVLPPGLGMICLPSEVLMNDKTIVRFPE